MQDKVRTFINLPILNFNLQAPIMLLQNLELLR